MLLLGCDRMTIYDRSVSLYNIFYVFIHAFAGCLMSGRINIFNHASMCLKQAKPILDKLVKQITPSD